MSLVWVRSLTGASDIGVPRKLQSLWGGYGEVLRVPLHGGPAPSVIVKRVTPPAGDGRGHRRKLHSYAVEQTWYQDFAERCGPSCRVPRCWGLRRSGAEWWFVLEDLDASGYPGRRHRLSWDEAVQCTSWLATFHGTFLAVPPRGLWDTGTYWHLATRPEEHRAMPDGTLKRSAGALDAALEAARFKTLVHGDAKPANFCFGQHGVAAVDFQYVGGGVGVRDLAYLMGALSETLLRERGEALIGMYFTRLLERVENPRIGRELEEEWRGLFDVAWADFERFMAGWGGGQGTRRRAFNETHVQGGLARVGAR